MFLGLIYMSSFICSRPSSHWKVYHSAGLRANRPTEHLFALWLSLSALGTWLQLSRNTVGAGVNSSSSPTCEGFIMCKTLQWTRCGRRQGTEERMKQTVLSGFSVFLERKSTGILMACYESFLLLWKLGASDILREVTWASNCDSSIRKVCRACGNCHRTHMARVTTIIKVTTVAEVRVRKGLGRRKSHDVLTSLPPDNMTSLGTTLASLNLSTNFWTDVGVSVVQWKVPEPSHDQPCGVTVWNASILCAA